MSYGVTMTQNGLAAIAPDLQTLLLLMLATAGLAAFARALWFWPKSWLLRKPLGCPVCMSGWAGFGVLRLAAMASLTPGWGPEAYVLAWFACVGGAALVFRQLYPPEVELPFPE